jgi:hypothetical protein
MGPAIIGLVGVIIGAMFSGGFSLLTTRRSNKQKARASSRLIETELRSAIIDLYALRANLEIGSDPSIRENILEPPTEWNTHRSSLAAILSNKDWYAIESAYESLEVLQTMATFQDHFPDGRPRNVSMTMITETIKSVEAGATSLSKLAGNPTPLPDFRMVRNLVETAATKNSQRPTSE